MKRNTWNIATCMECLRALPRSHQVRLQECLDAVQFILLRRRYGSRSEFILAMLCPQNTLLLLWGRGAVHRSTAIHRSAVVIEVVPRHPKISPPTTMHTYNCNSRSYGVRVCAGSAIPLEYNIDWLNGVSYDKGCYVGQELVARVHFGGLVRKRLYCVQFEQPQRHSGVEDTLVFIAGKESSIGTLRGAQGVHGIAHLRISDVEASFKRGNKLHVKLGTNEVSLTPSSPEWWPKK